MTDRLIMTMGLPRPGKSTWAMKQRFPVVNPDSIRLAIHGKAFISSAEKFVWATVHTMVDALFIAGHRTVILDATNTTKARRADWMQPKKWDTEIAVFLTSKAICVDRAHESGRDDLIPIIVDMLKLWNGVIEDEGHTKQTYACDKNGKYL